MLLLCLSQANLIMEGNSDAGEAETTQELSEEKHVDRFGFVIADNFHKQLSVNPSITIKRKLRETKREAKWKHMLSNWESINGDKLKSRIRKGIPDSYRRQVWYLLSNGDHYKRMYPILDNLPVATIDALTRDEIERDIDRTFPYHLMFEEENGPGQCSLRRVLLWYSSLDKKVGYCQGMGFVAGMLLTYMPEDEAFYCFTGLLQNPRSPLRDLYLPKMIDAQRRLYVFGALGALHLPKLWAHFEAQGIHHSMYATEWLMCVFCRGFSFDLVTRVWDIYLSEGFKIVYRVCLALLKNIEQRLLAAPFEDMMGILREIPSTVDADALIQLCWTIPLKRAQIIALEGQCLGQFNASQKKDQQQQKDNSVASIPLGPPLQEEAETEQ